MERSGVAGENDKGTATLQALSHKMSMELDWKTKESMERLSEDFGLLHKVFRYTVSELLTDDQIKQLKEFIKELHE